ncbi:MAG: GIY-YIG nuclease family protein [Chloroflexi bacterium]|nr:GIY-YIG nuclease family protein [Chloroflexota bacterium]
MPKVWSGLPPDDARAIRGELNRALDRQDSRGRRVGNGRRGVYAFLDYDEEPIYVGQTVERLRTRIRRHLTNQRTDAVAMNVLDPFEVAFIEMWPFLELEAVASEDQSVKETLNAAEYTVYRQLTGTSVFRAVLNEVPVTAAPIIWLPESTRARIIPDEIYERRKHPDERIARRAATIARLAQVISERSVQPGLRLTLLTQARRLEHLAAQRLDEVGGPPTPGAPLDLNTNDEGPIS